MERNDYLILGLVAIVATSLVAVYAIQRDKQIKLGNSLLSLKVG